MVSSKIGLKSRFVSNGSLSKMTDSRRKCRYGQGSLAQDGRTQPGAPPLCDHRGNQINRSRKQTVACQTQYQQKRRSAADAVRVVRNGDTIVVPTAVGEPPALLTALSEARRVFRDVQVVQILPQRPALITSASLNGNSKIITK